jgi:Zn-dependent peptidase ImmA (M78 family)/DNA-binding XRE family transcriptional regulator
MHSESKNIFGLRLKFARKMAGLSLQELAHALQNKVTKQALSKYENGQMKPTMEVILAIANILKIKPDYLLKKKIVQLGEVLFRKKARLAKKAEESIVEKVRDYVERYLEIEEILNVKSEFENPVQNIEINQKQDVESAAKRLREKWNLGLVPISNLVEILESEGVKVFLLEADDDFDGLAVLSSANVPIVAVNTKDKPIERLRFTIIHELAHIILKFSDEILNNPRELEKCCHYFSSCFLIPTEILLKKFGTKRSYISIEELISVKESYGMSLRAIVHRLKEIKVITETYYKRWNVYLTKTHGAKKEPGIYKGEERAKTFNQLVNRALAEELISISKAASLWNVNIADIRKGFNGF